MKKRTIVGIIAGVVAVPLLLSSVFLGNKGQAGSLLDSGAMRNLADIEGEEFVSLDDEAIALADTSGDNSSLRSEALKAYNLVNEQREAAGLGTLSWDSDLETTSVVRAREISEKFSHTRPNGSQWYTINSKIMGGENLAYGYNNADEVLEGWMDSPTHRENILYATFTKVAISIYEADDGTLYWAQEFGY
ncbi:MAG: CAP domain-containing protein [Lachnospiraceae bacterium]|nr:CAP domain-containing protein [Lachnospiraceae bacterium]